MSLGIRKKFRKGAASFYIVAFSTLILLIVATSFAAIIISEIERTSNDDLSQSAYDSALAGIEDAKLAFYNYQNCVAQGDEAEANCKYVINEMENSNCYMVGRTLGRLGEGEENEVKVKESRSLENNMVQSYTCVKVDTVLDNYESDLSSAKQYKVIKLKFDEVNAADVKKVKVSWYKKSDANTARFTNFSSSDGVVFPKAGTALWSVPPTISVALVQTADNFNFGDFDVTKGNTTDRGMVYLVPVGDATKASSSKSGNYIGAYDSDASHNYEGTRNHIGINGFLNSNKKVKTNVPYGVYCDPNSGGSYACSAMIDIPDPVGGARNEDTFMLVVALPYGQPTTSFALDFYCNTQCATKTRTDETGKVVADGKTNKVKLDGVQIGVDSTGRANDLYRRLEVRLESAGNDANLTVMGPLELTGLSSSGSGSTSDNASLQKTMTVKCEANFTSTPNCT